MDGPRSSGDGQGTASNGYKERVQQKVPMENVGMHRQAEAGAGVGGGETEEEGLEWKRRGERGEEGKREEQERQEESTPGQE